MLNTAETYPSAKAEDLTSPFDDALDPVPYEQDSNSDSDSDVDSVNAKQNTSRRPPENSFTQQRLAAIHPVFSSKTVVPILFLIGILLVPLGAGMWYASHQVKDVLIDYTYCEVQASYDTWTPIPDEYVMYRFRNKSEIGQAMWMLELDDSIAWEDERTVCKLQFHIPEKMSGPIYFFYQLVGFYQNHRRYAKSFSEDQLNGKAALVSVIKDTVGLNCEPLSIDDDGKIIYPCGLIANSLFNDTYSSTLTAVNGSTSDYQMTNEGIAWKSAGKRYLPTEYDYTQIVPPPNWAKMYPDGYNSTNVPDILTWEEFQNWMMTSAFPDFRKMALRNDDDDLESGIYELSIGLHFPVLPYKGKKSILISQRSILGGKNPFFGISWIAAGGFCMILAVLIVTVNLVRPRKTADVSLLSWNRESFAKDEQ